MEIKKRTRFIIAFLALFIFLSMIQDAYAKYTTSADANTNMTIARWGITINNQDVVSNNDFSDTITPVFAGTDYIAEGIIAPTSEGYFDIVINHNQVDVAFSQTINLSYAEDNTITDFKIVGYSLNNGSVVYFTGTPTISASIGLNPPIKTNTYRIYVKWLDGTDETMDNTDDTNATIDGIANIKVNVSFVQMAG